MDDVIDSILADVYVELIQATAKHGPMHSAHEGYAILLEEVEELWAEVIAQDRDVVSLRHEAVQVAALAVRLVHDVCDTVYLPTQRS